MYEYKRSTLVKTSMSCNFVKHLPIQNSFNNEISQSTVDGNTIA